MVRIRSMPQTEYKANNAKATESKVHVPHYCSEYERYKGDREDDPIDYQYSYFSPRESPSIVPSVPCFRMVPLSDMGGPPVA